MIQYPLFLKAALTADALNLGPHWLYNQAKVARTYPEGVKTFSNPLSNYHPGKVAGDFTHYGDSLALVLRTFTLTGKWDHSLYSMVWQKFWSHSSSYVDGATTQTLAHLTNSSNPVSTSNDIAGAAMAVSLISLIGNGDEAALVSAVRTHTEFTHNDPETVDTAEFFTHVVLRLLDGSTLTDSLDQAASISYTALNAIDYLQQARNALASEDHLKVASNFGLTCHNPEALPLTLYYLLRNPTSLSEALSENALAGGDNSARAILLAVVLTAANGNDATLDENWKKLTQHAELNSLLGMDQEKSTRRKPLKFANQEGTILNATLELPPETPRAYAIVAHCFTCGQSSRGATRITAALAAQGIATLRFDFSGLGRSEGEFSDTSFLTNTQDLIAAAEYLANEYGAPSLLIGHSLGGAAVLASAHALPSVKAVATIGAPVDPTHVQHLFADHLEEIQEKGIAEVSLAGRPFKIGKRFLDDVRNHCQPCHIAELKRDLLVLHAPNDDIVGIQNAADIYSAAKHPKSFISLTNADHLLLKPGAAEQAADLIAAWAKRSIG